MGKSEEARARILIRGTVQGVGFRYYVLQKAQEMRLKGYTQNLPNGEVEAVVEGDKLFIEDLYRAMQRGPTKAKVKDHVIEWSDPKNQFRTFLIKK
ncbi:acylphosphatase [Leptospira bourretii]|uniref:acylphosphatase n=4 Tax=Leptospira TaxID=171 RepID=A0A4R9IQG0_9LEPT|nr:MULTISPECIES: acylphosphatase [Leptospira]MCG6140165.1 acylphosphatase [Leptospira mtsangambouensis]MCG6150846.1 acylphosphatase [Leptospira bandrabouensis]MCT8334331.1 acylphosphatase [Leptospira sp. 85282-16]MCW7457153.1 acylphosphatase [Leptospira bandrabouensis]MCW7476099.1 acylphosphatase [Leptospira bandrabouensis]